MSTAAVPFWRSAVMTYITYSNICANLVRNCLKEPFKSEAIGREKVHFSVSKWADGKPQKPTMSENSKYQTRLFDSIVPSSAGNLGRKLQFSQAESFPGAMNFRRYLHSDAPKEFEKETDTRPYETDGNARPNEMFRNIRSIEMERNPRNSGSFERRWNRDIERNTGPFEMRRDAGILDSNMNSRNTGPFERGLGARTTERNTRLFDSNGRPNDNNIRPLETGRDTGSMNFAKGILDDNGRDYFGGNRFSRHTIEQNADIVHIKLMRNNSYVTVTDSKGNKKVGASGGLLSAMKGGPKVSRYSAEATAEYVGRLAKNMGLKSVVVKVNGFTYFKKKKQAILGFRDGYTNSRSDQNPIVYIEDTTRRAHNGCRLRKKRRI